MQRIFSLDQSQLLVELGDMLTVTAKDSVNQFGQVPLHKLVFWFALIFFGHGHYKKNARQ
jgi:hypothetical protein